MTTYSHPSDHYTWPIILKQIIDNNELSIEQLEWAMSSLLSSSIDNEEKAAFIMAMSMKKMSPRELDVLSQIMMANAREFPKKFPAIDIVGTGADNSHSYNISTMATVVAAAAGARVIKHGSRSASSTSGGADMLEQLGIALEPSMDDLVSGIENLNIGFCFAPYFHPMFSSVAPLRKKLKIPTFLNWVGPISNPASVQGGLIGCASPALMNLYAEVYALRSLSGMIIRGNDGLDELTVCSSSRVLSIIDKEIYEWEFSPQDVGLTQQAPNALKGGDAQENAAKAREVFSGKSSAVSDAVILNAGAAIAIAQTIPGAFHGSPARDLAYSVPVVQDDRASIMQNDSIHAKELLRSNPLKAISYGLDLAQRAILDGSVERLVESWANLGKSI